MKSSLIYPNATLLQVIELLEYNIHRLVVVISDNRKVIGTVTDGDIRRHLLSGGDLNAYAHQVMQDRPFTVVVGTPKEYIRDQLKKRNIVAVPVTDKNGTLIDVIHINNFDYKKGNNNVKKCFKCAVIMAGGEGLRLRPVTLNTPKPMVKIGDVPLIERQILKLVEDGISRVFISLNYMSEKFEDYFGDGSKYGIEIIYIKEKTKMGTAGAIGLIEQNLYPPFLVINGDILTTIDFKSLYEFHTENNADLTIGAIFYKIEVPYGVLETKGVIVQSIEEKPTKKFLCNAGMYALSSKALSLIQKNEFLDMSEFIEKCINDNYNVVTFPLHEYWSDIGTMEDLESAREFISKKQNNDKQKNNDKQI